MKIVKKFLIIAILTAACVSEEAPKNPLDNIQITADSMQYDTSHKHAQAQGNVRLTYMVKSMPVTLTATDLRAQFDDNGKLIDVVAEGNVKITYDETHLNAQTCTHNFNSQQAVCVGPDVKLTQNRNELHGNKATLDFATQVFTMHANESSQITSIIYPEKEARHKNS